jgi:hypothetical protein
LKISKAVIRIPPQFVVTVCEKSLKISKAVIKVPTQFVVTVYEKRLKITKAGNLDYRFGYLQTLPIYSHHNKLCGNLDYRFGYLQTLLINSQSKLWGNISKAVIKVPTQFVVTVYEKSLVTSNCLGTLITALDIFKLFSYTVTTTNCVGTLITALDIFKLFS